MHDKSTLLSNNSTWLSPQLARDHCLPKPSWLLHKGVLLYNTDTTLLWHVFLHPSPNPMTAGTEHTLPDVAILHHADHCLLLR
jgi:hypothetical protein